MGDHNHGTGGNRSMENCPGCLKARIAALEAEVEQTRSDLDWVMNLYAKSKPYWASDIVRWEQIEVRRQAALAARKNKEG